MLVVGLLGVLMGLAYPVYNNYRARVNSNHAVMQISMMATSIQNYHNDRRAYPNDLSDVGLGGAQDPWGRPYSYYNIEANGKGGARKDHALNPINTDFDLFSPGPDGQSKSQITQKSSVDDVIRASNGRFVGVAAEFAAR